MKKINMFNNTYTFSIVVCVINIYRVSMTLDYEPAFI